MKNYYRGNQNNIHGFFASRMARWLATLGFVPESLRDSALGSPTRPCSHTSRSTLHALTLHALTLHALTLLTLLTLPLRTFAGISEPSTVFYGKIVNRTSGQEYQLTNGHLVWLISRADGSRVTLSTEVTVLRGGDFSYRLDVPHQALSSGLDIASNSVPLTIQPSSCSNVQVSVDGFPATIIAPGSAAFAVAQSLRASTYRLDLELSNALPDSDGDGIPDWWANRYGVDDANADPDHDGWSNRAEFLKGTRPDQDNRVPSLQTGELTVYGDGTTGIPLRAIDSDSTPTSLVYTLTALPDAGTLFLRNSVANTTSSDVALTPGASFTQEDVNKGRLVFVQSGASSALRTSLGVSLRDEDPSHAAANSVITLNVYRPNYSSSTLQQATVIAATPSTLSSLPGIAPEEQQMVLNYLLSRDQGYIIWDLTRSAAPEQLAVATSGLTQPQYAQYVASYGQDRRQVLLGGSGGDYLVGGMESDILVGGRGNDRLRGNGGSDLFVISGQNDGNDTLEDFRSNDGDVIDISRVLQGSSTSLGNYVQLTQAGTNSYLNINFQGIGASFSDMVITLAGVQLTQNDLRSLAENGNLLTGNKVFPPRISIAATIPNASQNGPAPGLFTLTRSGGGDAALTVNLLVAGSARPSIDYDLATPQATFVAGQIWAVNFLAGEKTVTVPVTPYATIMGGTKVAQITIVSGTGYDPGASVSASVTIEDLLPQISIEALNTGIAVKSDLTPGYFLINRSGIINQSVLVRLSIGGTATRSSDYDGVPSFVNLNAGDTTALITVTPKASAILSNGLEYVQVSLQTNSSYKIFTPSTARVFIVNEMLNFSLWQQRNFPASSENWSAFAWEDPGNTGIRNLYRYAFGLNPQNPWSSPGVPLYRIVDGHLTVSFRHPVAVSDLDYVVEVSDDLLRWRSSGNDVESFFSSVSPSDMEMVSFRSKDPITQTPWRFMRVRVVTP